MATDRDQMSICVVGGYGRENLGDDLLQRVLTRWLSPASVTFRWVGEPLEIDWLNQFQAVVLGGGSHWPCRFLETLEDPGLTVPYSLVGLSAREAWDVDRTTRLLDHAQCVILRDRASADLLHNHPAIRTSVDMSWLDPLAPADDPSATMRRVGLNLRYWPERQLPGPALAAACGLEGAEVVPLPFARGGPELFPVPTRRDGEVLRDAGLDTPDGGDPETLRGCDVVVGMRYHSLVLAAQAGIPFIGIDDHAKVRAFCDEIGLGRYGLPAGDVSGLVAALRRLRKEWAGVRAHLLDIRDEQCANAARVYGDAKRRLAG